MSGLERRDEHTRGEVMAAVAAVETSEGPVSGAAYRALGDAGLRELVRETLGHAGRVLIECGEGHWTSGYDDAVADELIASGLARLDATDRAVLAMVLLHCVAIPRAAGRISSPDWTEAEPVARELLHQNREIPNVVIDRSVRRLQARGILRRGRRAEIRPGPQFLRLTESRSRALWEDLVLLCRPTSVQAGSIRRRRTQQEAKG
jgi:hypothetical protein